MSVVKHLEPLIAFILEYNGQVQSILSDSPDWGFFYLRACL